LLIVVLFDFLNIKSVKIYAIPFIFSTTLLLYKLNTLLLKQNNLSVLDITGFFFRIRTQVTALVLRTSAFTWVVMRKKKPVIYAPRPSPEYSCGKRNPLYPIRAASFVTIALYVIFKPRPIYFRWLLFVIYFISKGFLRGIDKYFIYFFYKLI
jgi:hypothetical protein